jgi:hypothetical protein
MENLDQAIEECNRRSALENCILHINARTRLRNAPEDRTGHASEEFDAVVEYTVTGVFSFDCTVYTADTGTGEAR